MVLGLPIIGCLRTSQFTIGEARWTLSLFCVKLGKAAQLKRREDELEDRLARPQWIAMDSNG